MATIVSPATVAQQITVARAQRAQKPVFTSETGVVRHYAPEVVEDFEEFCFICSRATDHVGEHDDAVEAGTALYETDTREWTTEDGSVKYVTHYAYVLRADMR